MTVDQDVFVRFIMFHPGLANIVQQCTAVASYFEQHFSSSHDFVQWSSCQLVTSYAPTCKSLWMRVSAQCLKLSYQTLTINYRLTHRFDSCQCASIIIGRKTLDDPSLTVSLYSVC